MIAAGSSLFVLGMYLLFAIENPNQFLSVLPYVCVGFGCGIFGHGLGFLFRSGDAVLQKQMRIEENDERNIIISNRAKAKAFDVMTIVFGVLMPLLSLMGMGLAPALLVVFCYLFVQFCVLYFRIKYEKEM